MNIILFNDLSHDAERNKNNIIQQFTLASKYFT